MSIEKQLMDPNFQPPPLFCEPVDDTKEIITLNSSPLNHAKSDRFRIIFTLPKCVFPKNTFKTTDRLILKLVELPTPEITVPTIEENYLGRTLKHSSLTKGNYSDVTVNFVLDDKLETYDILYKWLNFLDDESTGLYGKKADSLVGHLPEYSTDICIYALDIYDNEKYVAEWKYEKAFITTLGQINWNHRGEGDDINCSFTFAFNFLKFTRNPVLNLS